MNAWVRTPHSLARSRGQACRALARCSRHLASRCAACPLAADTSQPPAQPGSPSMAARIDELLSAAWAREGIESAPPAGDLEFLAARASILWA